MLVSVQSFETDDMRMYVGIDYIVYKEVQLVFIV